jgi:hypothetical protein
MKTFPSIKYLLSSNFQAALIALSKDMSAVCITSEDVQEAKAMSSPSLLASKQGSHVT